MGFNFSSQIHESNSASSTIDLTSHENNLTSHENDLINQENILNRYKIVKPIGKGAFGKVFQVQKDNKYYALKKVSIIYTELTNNKIEEYNKMISILSNINNKYIIKYYQTFIRGDDFYILMEYGGNLNLKQFIANYKNKNKAIEEKTIKDIIKQICLGLKDIHDSNLIHRDLKPENIFVNEDNEIKVGDFGISKILSTNNRYATTKIGTFYYMAPEVVKGDIYNNKADIYSLGCITYELFTLNEYYIDKIIDKKECKINLNIYNSKWQKLIELLLESDYHQRPTIKEICDYIDKNQIILTVKINKNDLNKKIYFLDNTSYDYGNGISHNNLKEMNEMNTELYINDIKNKFKKYFIPSKEGLYIIKIIFYFSIKDCSYMFDH